MNGGSVMNKSWNRAGACLLAVSLAAFAVPATADDDCDVPIERWQTREAVTAMARQQGWDLKRVKIDGGCYEISGEDAEGRAFKAKLDPATLEVLKIKYRRRDDRDRDRDRDRHRDRDDAARGAPGAATAPPRRPSRVRRPRRSPSAAPGS